MSISRRYCKKALGSIIIIVVLVSVFIAAINIRVIPPAKADTNWLAGWQYRKSHVINNAIGAGANYQVMITVHYGLGVDSGGDVYCNSHSRTDFGDLRFTAADGSTLLSYWIQSCVASNTAVFWVKITDDLSSQARTVYIYYGKSDAITTSNGDDTFILFQDSFLLGAPNNANYLNIPTYDGSGQLAHLDIYYNADGWHGHKYWMVMTPYPNGDATKENPSIVVSEDGQNWSVPGGLSNPIVPYPGSGRHNCDPDLVYNPDTDELLVYFLDALDGATSYVKLTKSSDGVTWSSPVTVITVSDVANIVSPSVVKIGNNWYMWTVNTHGLGWSAADTDVELRTSVDGTNWGLPSNVTGITPTGYNVWHFNVIYVPSLGEFWASLGSYKDGQQGDACDLFMAKSSDGTSWIVQNFLAIKKGGTGAWDSGGLYRSVFLYDFANAIFRVWYVGHTNGNTGVWRLGYTETNTVSAFNKMLATSQFGAPNSANYLNIPTYDGSGQLAHLDIYYNPGGWHGHKYWMVMTPYPNGDATWENPSIVVSEDGQSWGVPAGLTNPIAPYPGSGRHNCDPDMVYNPDTDELWVYFYDALDGGTSYVKLTKSSDGVTWSTPVTVLTASDAANCVSPSVVKIGNNWYMWTVNTHGLGWSAPSSDVELRTSSDGANWGSSSTVNGFTPPGYVAWHPHVIYVPSLGEFWALSACYQAGKQGDSCDLFMAKSSDGMTWTAQSFPVMTKGGWNSGGLYRSTFLYDSVDGIFRAWYVGHTNGNTGVWRLGYTETNAVSEFNKMPTKGWWHPWSGGVTRQAGNYLLQTTAADNAVEGVQTVNAPFQAGTALYFKGYRGTGSAGTVLGSSKYGTDVNNDAVTFLIYASTLYARTRVGGSQTQNSVSLAGTVEGIYKIFWISSSSVKFYKDSTNLANHATNIPSGPLYVTMYNYDSGTILWVDWVFIRSYISPEPSHGSWGSEEQSQCSLTLNVNGGGSVEKSPDQATYTYGTVVTLTASASVGWTFAGWSGDALGTANPTNVTMIGNKAVTATFIQANLYIDPQLTQKTMDDVGATYKVNVTITDVIDLRGFDFNVTWDPSLLTLASVGFNTTLDSVWGNGNWVLAVNQSGAGYYKLVAVSTANSFNSTTATSLARLEFLVKNPQSNQLRQSSIHFDTHKLSDSQYNAITHTVTDGTYRISGETPTLQMNPTSRTCRKYNETFTVQIGLSNAFDVTDFEFEIHYNTTLLNYTDIAWNAWGSGSITIDEVNGNITGFTSGSAISGTQTLITLQFNATFYHIWKDENKVSNWKNDQSGQIYIQWANLSYSSNPDLAYVKGGTHNQINAGSDVTYTFSPIQGDVDNNGSVNVFDLRTVAAYYDQAYSTYDLNGDGIIDIFDLVVIGAKFGFTYP